jgi:PKD repeat protein
MQMAQLDLKLKNKIPVLDVKLVKLPPGLSVEEAISRFSQRPGVEFVEPNYILQIAAINQEEITDQWGLQKIDATQAWSTFDGQPKVPITLATVDSGIDPTHNDLSANMWSNSDEIPDNSLDDDNNGYVDDTWGWDFVNNDNDPFDDNLHGTAVSSVMVGDLDGDGVAGVCPWCQVMAVKVMTAGGTGTLDVVASGIIYAANSGAKVINLSLAGIAGTQTLQDAVDFAWSQDVLVVAGAGNDGANAPMYPAGYANAMAIGSTGETDTHSCFSNYAEDYISVVAPGENILVAIPNQGYGYGSGTSLSTPYVAGLGGLLFSQDPGRTNSDVRSLIESTAVDLSPPGVDAAFGHGRINAYRAVTNDQSQGEIPDGRFSTSNTATGYAHARKLVRDDLDGNLHMIWHTKEGTAYKIRYATSSDNGINWNLEPDVYSSQFETYHPAIATDGQNLFLAFPTRSDVDQPYQIKFTRRTLPDGDWIQPAVSLISGSYDAVRPDLYFDPTNDKLHLVASSLDNAPYIFYQASQDYGATWNSSVAEINPSTGTTGANSRTRYASIHASGDNIYIVARTVNTSLFTYYYMHSVRSTDGGQTWFDQFKISSYSTLFGGGEYGVSLAGVGDRVYMGYEVGSNIYFRYHDGTSWSAYETLELGDADYVYRWPTITQDQDGQGWMIFESNGEQFMRHYDGSTWAPKESIGAGSFANLKLGTNGDKLEWITTQCNGAPFLVSYDSRTLGANNPPNVPPTADFTYSTSDLTATFTDASTDSDGSVTSWTWDFGDSNTSTMQNPSYSYAAVGTYTVTLTVTDNDEDTDSMSKDVTVTEPPNIPPTADFTYTTADLTATFTDASTDNDGNIISWSWVFGDGNSSTEPSPSNNYAAAGTYTVSLTVTDNDGDTDSMSKDVTVIDPPILVNALVSSEIFVAGSVSGNYMDTREDDDNSEAIRERDSGGKKVNRYSFLEHKWIFNVTPGNVVTLYANAWSSFSTDGDSFTFAYSTDDTSYTDMFVIGNDSNPGSLASYPLPASTQGTLYVRVTDSDQNAGNRELNSIYVDHLFIRSETQAGSPPTAPSDLNASAGTPTQINLSWTDNSLDEYGFEIDRSLDNSNWSQIDSVGADVNNYIDMTVSPNTTYFYRVRAFNGSGSSSYSNTANAATPDGLALEAIGYKIKGKHTVDLTWSGGSLSLVDIYRDGSLIFGGKTGGTHKDLMENKGGASYLYRVCETGIPTNCSNTVQVDF